jgi:hypothetical protein
LHSRFSTIEFRISKEDKQKLAGTFFKRVLNILKEENVPNDPKVVAKLIEKFFPDWRRVLNELQRYSASGSIDTGLLSVISDESMKELVSFLRENDFGSIRKWVVKNLDNDPTRIYRKIYDELYVQLQPNTVPYMILAIADYQYKSAFVADQEINMLACLTEIMGQVKFK